MGDIIVYVKSGCPYCAELIKELDGKGKSYIRKNVSEDKQALQEVKVKYNANKVPVMVEGAKTTIGHGGKG